MAKIILSNYTFLQLIVLWDMKQMFLDFLSCKAFAVWRQIYNTKEQVLDLLSMYKDVNLWQVSCSPFLCPNLC